MILERLTKRKIKKLLPYFQTQNFRLCNYSAGVLFMWNKVLSPEYAIIEDCLIIKETYDKISCFYYPISLSHNESNEILALGKIEEYCKEHRLKLRFTDIPDSKIEFLVKRYGADLHVYNPRRWRDYIYLAENFKTYAGGAFSGQRNHVNKFKKTYPDYKFTACACSGDCSILNFLNEYESYQMAKGNISATTEMKSAKELMPHVKEFKMMCGYITVGGKIIAVSVGEKCGDTLIVHIEKALHEYQGVYPTIAQEFANAYATGDIKYINREDDSGDLGLRKSKLNYLPWQVANKYSIEVNLAIDSVKKLPILNTERLTLCEVKEKDAPDYANLAKDLNLNKHWGYDWQKDFKDGEPEDIWFLKSARSDFKKKEEMPLGIYLQNVLIGEVVLHNFGYSQDAEIGVRLLQKYQGQGFAKEALYAYMRYAFSELNLEKIHAKCFKQNDASAKSLQSAGLRKIGEDDTYFYFLKTPAM